jgi:hypothetical protein
MSGTGEERASERVGEARSGEQGIEIMSTALPMFVTSD